jgi:hypothetical protein
VPTNQSLATTVNSEFSAYLLICLITLNFKNNLKKHSNRKPWKYFFMYLILISYDIEENEDLRENPKKLKAMIHGWLLK